MPDPKSAASGALSRRAVVGAASAGPLAPSLERLAAFNQSAMLCKVWLAIEAERYRLTRRWVKLESQMIKNHEWFNLTDGEQLALPEAAEMHAIDVRLTTLQKDREEILPQLPALVSGDKQALLLKFGVVEMLLLPDEAPEANAILKSALRDLAVLWG